MKNFIVSARKYRPDTFDSVVGQASITKTLKNAIKSKQIAHAFLFCGPRGVGKTTCARIFAKTINCINPDENLEACNKCESCKSFNESRSYNIHELDAASNNSVDDIRNLIEQIRVPPQIGKYSIYIVDEVHMLSQSAFNAFLKTLEEPPPHAIFILATTEKYKIIPTILSRCQIYDFNRIQIEDIVKYLEYISKQEGIEYEIDSFHIIAQKADGAMRDALSVFDQLISFSDKKITYKGVIESLNVLDYDYYFNLTTAFINQDVSKALLIFNEILNNGFDAHNFINGLSNHLRDLLVCKDEQTIQLLETGNTFKQQYLSQTKQCPPEFIYEALEICSACDIDYKASKNQRLHVELALVKLCTITGKKKSDVVREIKEPEIELTPEKSSVPVDTKLKQPPGNIAEEKKTEKQKQYTPDSKTISSISIKEALKDVDNVPAKNANVEKQENNKPGISEKKESAATISIDELKSYWDDFAESIKESMPRMYSTLKSHIPTINEKGMIELELSNDVQYDDFKSRIKPQLVSYLSEKCENTPIEIDLKLGKEANENKIPYTSDEKFEFMSKKNPILNKLKQEFNLDFE